MLPFILFSFFIYNQIANFNGNGSLWMCKWIWKHTESMNNWERERERECVKNLVWQGDGKKSRYRGCFVAFDSFAAKYFNLRENFISVKSIYFSTKTNQKEFILKKEKLLNKKLTIWASNIKKLKSSYRKYLIKVTICKDPSYYGRPELKKLWTQSPWK